MRRKLRLALSLALLMVIATGCTRTQSERGVYPLWRALPDDALEIGATTKSEVLAVLGPPSQVITHQSGEIFYYLYEEASSRGLILLVYNSNHINTRYDRAIFFFDENGVLQDYATSSEEAAQ